MKTSQVYSSKNIVIVSSMFMGIMFMLYLIGVHLHERQKIDDEIASIERQNKSHRGEITKKKRELEYLNTVERKEKEAKMQLGKKQQGERSITFIEEDIEILPKNELVYKVPSPPKEIPPLNNWQWLLLR